MCLSDRSADDDLPHQLGRIAEVQSGDGTRLVALLYRAEGRSGEDRDTRHCHWGAWSTETTGGADERCEQLKNIYVRITRIRYVGIREGRLQTELGPARYSMGRHQGASVGRSLLDGVPLTSKHASPDLHASPLGPRRDCEVGRRAEVSASSGERGVRTSPLGGGVFALDGLFAHDASRRCHRLLYPHPSDPGRQRRAGLRVGRTS